MELMMNCIDEPGMEGDMSLMMLVQMKTAKGQAAELLPLLDQRIHQGPSAMNHILRAMVNESLGNRDAAILDIKKSEALEATTDPLKLASQIKTSMSMMYPDLASAAATASPLVQALAPGPHCMGDKFMDTGADLQTILSRFSPCLGVIGAEGDIAIVSIVGALNDNNRSDLARQILSKQISDNPSALNFYLRAYMNAELNDMSAAGADYLSSINAPAGESYINPNMLQFLEENHPKVIDSVLAADDARKTEDLIGALLEGSGSTTKNKAQRPIIPDSSNRISTTYQLPADSTGPTIYLQRGVSVVSRARHTVTGQASDDSGVAIVEVNGREASLDEQGNFSADILLRPGSNTITITAIDVSNNQSTKSFVLERSAGQQASRPLTTQDQIRTGAYHALLIAVQDYAHPSISDLSQPVSDATTLKRTLGGYTFDEKNVSQLNNPTRAQILDEFDRLTGIIKPEDSLLIFYAGHGYWDERFAQGYWLPSDARRDRRSSWIPNGTIRDYIRGINTKHTLLVSDACFSGGIFKTRSAFNDAPAATNVLYKLPSRKAMTSGTLTEVPDKSVFVQYLVKRLSDNPNKYLSSETLFSSFRTAVINNSPTNQVPQFGEIRGAGDEGGDFIFVKR